MTPSATLERLDSVRERVRSDDRVSLSDFSRGREWRSRLVQYAFLELQEHGERTAWIVSEEGMDAILRYIDELETQAEQARVHTLLDTRRGRDEWLSGTELESRALAYLKENEADIMGAIR